MKEKKKGVVLARLLVETNQIAKQNMNIITSDSMSSAGATWKTQMQFYFILFLKLKLYFSSVSSSAAMASPTWLVVELPPISAVRTPLSMVIFVASSIFCAISGRHSEYLNIMLMERTVAMGLTMPLPAMSGAEPVGCEWENITTEAIIFLTMNRLVDTIQLGLAVGNTA